MNFFARKNNSPLAGISYETSNPETLRELGAPERLISEVSKSRKRANRHWCKAVKAEKPHWWFPVFWRVQFYYLDDENTEHLGSLVVYDKMGGRFGFSF